MVDILKLYVICSLPLCHIKLLAGREAGPGCRGLLLSICLPSRPHTCPVASHPLPCVSHPPPTTWLTQGLDFLFLPPRGPGMTSSSSPLLPHSCLIPPATHVPTTCCLLCLFSHCCSLSSPLPVSQVCRGLVWEAPTSPSPTASPAARLLRTLAETPPADKFLPGNWQVISDELSAQGPKTPLRSCVPSSDPCPVPLAGGSSQRACLDLG